MLGALYKWDRTMKEITTRFYDFTFEQLKELLKLKGDFKAYQAIDAQGKDVSTLTIMTTETKKDK